jgi:hypothetical protein
MLSAFPTPVLSIAADAVKDLEGRDALSGLWTCRCLLCSIIHVLIYIYQVFTKCKESLHDGRRLENISWRLWYREMMRDGLTNRLHQGDVNEKEVPDHALRPQTNLYRPPTPSESATPPLPPYVVQDANGLNVSTLSDRFTVLPQDHDHPSKLTFFCLSFRLFRTGWALVCVRPETRFFLAKKSRLLLSISGCHSFCSSSAKKYTLF